MTYLYVQEKVKKHHKEELQDLEVGNYSAFLECVGAERRKYELFVISISRPLVRLYRGARASKGSDAAETLLSILICQQH